MRRSYITMEVPQTSDDVQNLWKMLDNHQSSLVIVLGEPSGMDKVWSYITKDWTCTGGSFNIYHISYTWHLHFNYNYWVHANVISMCRYLNNWLHGDGLSPSLDKAHYPMTSAILHRAFSIEWISNGERQRFRQSLAAFGHLQHELASCDLLFISL